MPVRVFGHTRFTQVTRVATSDRPASNVLMQPTRGSLRTILTATLAILGASLHAQGQTVSPEPLAGEWETTMPSGGIHGVWLTIRTQHLAPKESTNQGIDFSFYHRQNGQETKPSSQGAFSFSGGRLRISGTEGLDVTFDLGTHRWTGRWFLEGENREVVLERPSCPSLTLCGAWEGRDPLGPVRIYIAQSSDGLVTAWMDRTSDPANQQHGQRLRVVSSDPQSVTVETLSAVCCTNRFTGQLSEDAQSLSGKWSSVKINVDTQQVFRRMLAIRRESNR